MNYKILITKIEYYEFRSTPLNVFKHIWISVHSISIKITLKIILIKMFWES